MASPTYLQLVNKVLKRLRENTVATVEESTYSAMIGEFINQAKDEVEDVWNWNVLRETLRVKTLPGAWIYTFTDAGANSRVLQVYNDSLDYHLTIAHRDYLTRLLTANTQTPGRPHLYDINSFLDDAIELNIYPHPDAEYWLSVDVVIPTPDLTLDTHEVVVPSQPVILRAYNLAVEERGEIGQAALEREDRNYNKILHQAITNDHDRHPLEKQWNPVEFYWEEY